MTSLTLSPIAEIRSDFPTKFGIPRQSAIVESLEAKIIFTPEYRNESALRGLEGFTHLWLIWGFSENLRQDWKPTVRPPRLGGNKRMGVFATRSPFRPNPIGLSSVRLLRFEKDEQLGHVLVVAGADLMSGTPIYDIKPYIAYTDSHPDASGGFSDPVRGHSLEVIFPESRLELVPLEKREALLGVLRHDPRPQYQHDPGRVYGFFFANLEVKFTVQEHTLTVCSVERVK